MVYSTMLYRIQMINSNSRLTSFKLTPFSWYKAGATPMTLTVSGSFQWRGKHYQIIFQTLLNKWLAVYVISIITIVLYMIVIGGIISIILCWFPWYYVNANKCTEGRRSTHFIQFRGSLHSVFRLHRYAISNQRKCTTCTTLTDFLSTSSSRLCHLMSVWWSQVSGVRMLLTIKCSNIGSMQIFYDQFSTGIFGTLWKYWNQGEI